MSWIKVEEHVPPAGKIVKAYSAVYGTYHFAQWNGPRGWLDQKGAPLIIVTDWDDSETDLPFPILQEADAEIAEKYGYKIGSHGFYSL